MGLKAEIIRRSGRSNRHKEEHARTSAEMGIMDIAASKAEQYLKYCTIFMGAVCLATPVAVNVVQTGAAPQTAAKHTYSATGNAVAATTHTSLRTVRTHGHADSRQACPGEWCNPR